MTSKPTVAARVDAYRLPPLPSPPKMDMEQTRHFVLPGVMSTLAQHLGAMIPGSDTLVSGNGYLCRSRADLPRCPYPDMLVAFGVEWESVTFTNGYVIVEAGKPPDLVLEVASGSTGRRDYTGKREIYAGLDVPEYWRFDHSGGEYHDAPLACDLLTSNGVYQPMALTTEPNGVVWGYSAALGLSVCWVEGRLRFWDRAQQRYLPDPWELTNERDSERLARANAEARATEANSRATEANSRATEADARATEANTRATEADARAASERQARTDADARIRELEEELRRLQG